MAGLQRSEISFRRQGSSGIVWDDMLLSGELKKISTKPDHHDDHDKKPSSASSELTRSHSKKLPAIQRSRSHGGARHAYRASSNVTPSTDPPSPKVSGCCGVFGKPAAAKSQPRQKSAGRRTS